MTCAPLHALPLAVSRSAGTRCFCAHHVRALITVALGLGGLLLTLAATIGLAAPFVIDALAASATEAAVDGAQPVTWGW